MRTYTIKTGQRRKEWRGWDGYDEFFEADEWEEFENEADYNKEIERLKKAGYEIYYQDIYETLFICE